jgi:hypothetical protein
MAMKPSGQTVFGVDQKKSFAIGESEVSSTPRQCSVSSKVKSKSENFVGKARHIAARVMVGLRLRDPLDRRAIDLNRVRKRLGRRRNEGKMYLHAGPGRVVIQHEEVVIVDRCNERLSDRSGERFRR